ncbi:MAG: hypothetical protein AMXMBFR34_35410 [Myxococcaceae bacterium]
MASTAKSATTSSSAFVERRRKVRDALRRSQHLPVSAAVAQVNPVLRGWVNYFRVTNTAKSSLLTTAPVPDPTVAGRAGQGLSM